MNLLRTFVASLISILIVFSLPVYAASIEVEVHSDVSLFYDELAKEGDWVNSKKNGWFWVPSTLPVEWRPYTIGKWSYSQEYGWLWVSGWSWGWATFHYGRWHFDSEYGWVWTPGTQWAPAWVAWHQHGNMIGWAPLPPDMEFPRGSTQLTKETLHDKIDMFAWSFVPAKELFSEKLHLAAISMSARNPTMLSQGHSLTRYIINKKRILNGGPDVIEIQQAYDLNIRQLDLIDVTFPKGVTQTQLDKNQVAVFRPIMTPAAGVTPKKPVTARITLTGDALNKRHKNKRKTLDIYHDAEKKALTRIHKEQLDNTSPDVMSNIQDQQHLERAALDTLQSREKRILENRLRAEGAHN